MFSSNYDYSIELFKYQDEANINSVWTRTAQITSQRIDTETKARWHIIWPSFYHCDFYYGLAPINLQIPTQITGGIAESITLSVFKIVFAANKILKISERPSSKTADFSLEINRNGAYEECIVESKGSNSKYSFNSRQLEQAIRQLIDTSAKLPQYKVATKFASIVSFQSQSVRIYEVI
jgi:hypothetical protein